MYLSFLKYCQADNHLRSAYIVAKHDAVNKICEAATFNAAFTTSYHHTTCPMLHVHKYDLTMSRLRYRTV
jgi:hypothetical protein